MLLFIFLIFLMIFIILCLFFWKKFQSLDKETRIVLDQYTGLIQKTILSILTIGVPSAQGEFVSIRNLLVTSVVIFVQ